MRFGKYDLHDRIAAGGMAEVFRGSLSGDSGFERPVAIKRILPELTEDREFVSMFVDEAKIAVQLSHANIAQILDLGCHDGAYFIAMEYVHGRDIRAILERERRRGGGLVPVPLACHATMKVAEALHHAHNATGRDGRPLGIIHRDISPQNVLLSFEGEVKVVDFGLAKAAGRLTQTQAGVVKGKLAYLSPQQALGEEIDHRSDVYSLGLVFFEMLTGRRAFEQRNDIETILAVQAGNVPRLRQLAPRLPSELESILSRALERDVERRYQTAMELHDDLQVFVYDTGELVTRRDVARYVRELFEQEPQQAIATAATVMEDHGVNDTIPAPPPETDDPETEQEEKEDGDAPPTDVTEQVGEDEAGVEERRDTLITDLKDASSPPEED